MTVRWMESKEMEMRRPALKLLPVREDEVGARLW